MLQSVIFFNLVAHVSMREATQVVYGSLENTIAESLHVAVWYIQTAVLSDIDHCQRVSYTFCPGLT